MTTEIEDRRRRRGGVLLALVLAFVAAWLVYLWLDGIEGNRAVDADTPVATTLITPPPATTTTVDPTTTTVAVTTAALDRPDIGAIVSAIREIEVGGHTDSAGGAASNQPHSQA